MIQRNFVLLISLFIVEPLFSQNDSLKRGTIDYFMSNEIEQVIKLTNEKRSHQEIYKVQFFSETGNSAKQLANEIKSEFELKFKDIQVSLVYQQPNFKLRAGNFRNRLDAQRFLNQVKLYYPNSFIVKDDGKLASE
jgi:hypothetical protein